MLNNIFEEFKSMLVDLFNLTNIQAELYNRNRVKIYSYPVHGNKLCNSMQSVSTLFTYCGMCIKNSFDYCEKTCKPHIFKCYIGSVIIVVPVLDKNEIIGFLRLSNIVLDSDKTHFSANLKEIIQDQGDDSALDLYLLRILGGIEYTNNKTIKSVVNVLNKYTNIDRKTKASISRDITKAQDIKKYIDEHISEPLTVSYICKELYISKTGLYTIAKGFFGMGISDYIREKRIEHSKRLLTTSDMSITQIASEIGFSDANYFTRVFKSAVGISPRLYRNNMNK